MRAKSNLKELLDLRGITIRQFAEMTGLPFETLRRLYNDTTKQYQRNTIGVICKTLNVGIGELLILADDEE
ncbi:helix-turn-helix transcriptional regulator [Bacillus badius]|uniref:helix-turn-helix domain-containing protein n=1 Tax=Bacillus badius TaxID=1455 RepID=UPI001CBF057E|nr:helix-turn-helix transcriptional regulator [Bacillus badius]UAT30033.1 helix-turn-helix transcriptional regulator [Bacillus badius]